VSFQFCLACQTPTFRATGTSGDRRVALINFNPKYQLAPNKIRIYCATINFLASSRES
jgi:hypothetical protein